MNFLQRALKSVTRRKGKSLILFLVIFVLGNVIAGAVAIQQSTTNVEKETKRKMGAVATVEFDYESYDKDNAEISDEEKYNESNFPKPPTSDVYDKIGELSYVKYHDYTMNGWMETKKIKAYSPEDQSISMGGQYFTLKGSNLTEPLDLQEGKIKLIDGESFSEKDVTETTNSVWISQEVAEANGVSVGDQMILDVTGQSFTMAEEQTEGTEGSSETIDAESETKTFDFPVKVIGIFSVIKKEESSSQSQEDQTNQAWQAMDQINTIYASNNLVKDFTLQQNEKIYGTTIDETEIDNYFQAMYVLNSPDDIDAFKQEAAPLLPEYYHVVASTDQYDTIAGSMKKLGSIAQYVVIIAAIASIFIISLVVLLFLRDRKHELGIYLSLGEGRSKVIGQIVVELLLVSLLALVLSLVTGNLLGGAVSNSLMQSDWMNTINNDGMIYAGNSLLGSDLSFGDIQSAYKVSFTAGYIITYLLLGIGSVLLSAILPLLYILRLNPKKIMM